MSQRPQLDDNGDGLFDAGDGALARTRYLTDLFTSTAPTINLAGTMRSGGDVTLEATVSESVEEIALVWANIYPPGFRGPTNITLNLNVPLVRLDPVAGQPGQYRFSYPGGVPNLGIYRVVIYAQDRLGYHAVPAARAAGGAVYLLDIGR